MTMICFCIFTLAKTGGKVEDSLLLYDEGLLLHEFPRNSRAVNGCQTASRRACSRLCNFAASQVCPIDDVNGLNAQAPYNVCPRLQNSG